MNEDNDIKSRLESVVLYQVDSEKGDGLDLAKEYRIKAYPSFVMVNGQGETIDRWIGYEKAYFTHTLESALKDLSAIEEKQARHEKKPNAGDAVVLGRYNSALGNYGKSVEYYKLAQKMKSDPEADYTYEIFTNIANGIKGGSFSFDEARAAADVVIESMKAHPREKYGVSRTMTYLAREYDHLDIVERYLDVGLEVTKNSNDPDTKIDHAELMVDYALYVSRDKDRALQYKKETMPEGWMDDAAKLNGFCWWCFENLVNLEDAEKLSRRSVELAESGKQKAMNLDTLAEICNALENCREAVEFIKQAIAENPDSDYYPEQLERFEKILASKN